MLTCLLFCPLFTDQPIYKVRYLLIQFAYLAVKICLWPRDLKSLFY